MEADTGLDHFEIEISDNVGSDVLGSENALVENESTDAAGCEIQISENTPETSNTNANSNKGQSADLLRASLSDVVLNQSLQFTGKDIDLDDSGNKNSTGEFVGTFDSLVPEKKTHEDSFLAFEGERAAKDEFSDLITDSGIALAEQDSNEAASVPVAIVSASPQISEKPHSDIADFDDAFDPPLLTSTLKADVQEEDSDDEFDFDLPGAKTDKGKTVRFSAGEDGIVAGQKVSGIVPEPEVKEVEKTAPIEPQGDTTAASVDNAASGIQKMGGDGDAAPVVSEVKVELAPVTPDEVKPEQDESEKEDRSHIITSSAADWDNVQTVEAGYVDASGEGAESMTAAPPLQNFSDFWNNFRTMDQTAVKDKIQVTVEKSGFAAIVSRLFGPPRLNKNLHTERELVFCIAATALDNRSSDHLQSLQTVYRVLTGSRFNCQRYGSHWEEVGFQGSDPSTDLRGTGMLGLAQMVNFLQDDTTAQLARDMYKLSLHPTQNFPFCVMCINISRISLQALREGILNRECNRQQGVMSVVNQFYAAALLYLYRLWKQGKTISDSGFVIRDVETRAKKKTKDLFKDFQTYVASQKSGKTASSMPGGLGEGDATFFNVVKSDTKTAAELY